MFRIGIILSLLLLIACNKGDNELKVTVKRQEVVDHSIRNSLMIGYDDTSKIWELRSTSILKGYSKDSTLIVPIKLHIFSDTGNITTTVIADSGIAPDDNMTYFFLWGNVYIINEDSTEIVTTSLSWNKKEEKIKSDDFVEIRTSSGERMRGKGFEAKEDFSEWEFYNNVDGEFPNLFNEIFESHDSTTKDTIIK